MWVMERGVDEREVSVVEELEKVVDVVVVGVEDVIVEDDMMDVTRVLLQLSGVG